MVGMDSRALITVAKLLEALVFPASRTTARLCWLLSWAADKKLVLFVIKNRTSVGVYSVEKARKAVGKGVFTVAKRPVRVPAVSTLYCPLTYVVPNRFSVPPVRVAFPVTRKELCEVPLKPAFKVPEPE